MTVTRRRRRHHKPRTCRALALSGKTGRRRREVVANAGQRRHLDTNWIPQVQLGRYRRFREEALDQWLEALEWNGTSPSARR